MRVSNRMRRPFITLVTAFSAVMFFTADRAVQSAVLAETAPTNTLITASIEYPGLGKVRNEKTHFGHAEHRQPNTPTGAAFFAALIVMTAWEVYAASGRTKKSADLCVVHRSTTVPQKFRAQGGCDPSAASFVGITGLISVHGYYGLDPPAGRV